MGLPRVDTSKQSHRHRWRRGKLPIFLAFVACCAARSSQSSDLVSIGLEGEIEAQCQVHLTNASTDLGQISVSGSKSIPFILNCNTPFAYNVRSRERGLKHSDQSAHHPSFAGLIPYTLDLRIPTDAAMITEQCVSGSLGGTPADCAHGASGDGIALNQSGSLTVSWYTDSELLAGVYSDVLTLTVRPQF